MIFPAENARPFTFHASDDIGNYSLPVGLLSDERRFDAEAVKHGVEAYI